MYLKCNFVNKDKIIVMFLNCYPLNKAKKNNKKNKSMAIVMSKDLIKIVLIIL